MLIGIDGLAGGRAASTPSATEGFSGPAPDVPGIPGKPGWPFHDRRPPRTASHVPLQVIGCGHRPDPGDDRRAP